MEHVAFAPTSHHAWQDTGAVVAGLAAVGGLSHAADAVLRATDIFPAYGAAMSGSLFLLALGYRTLFGVLGGFIAARLASGLGARQATILGAIGTVLGTLGLAASWKHPEVGPIWCPIALVLVALPSARLGAVVARGR